MQVRMTSMFTGVSRVRDIDITDEQLDKFLNRGELIQDVCGHLSADDREFLLTGATPEEWQEVFGE